MAAAFVKQHFESVLQSGHKQHALEVPFDPADLWGVAPQALWPGRRGYRVHAICGGVNFDSAIVARSRRWWLLVDDEVRNAAGWREGQCLPVALAPTP